MCMICVNSMVNWSDWTESASCTQCFVLQYRVNYFSSWFIFYSSFFSILGICSIWEVSLTKVKWCMLCYLIAQWLYVCVSTYLVSWVELWVTCCNFGVLVSGTTVEKCEQPLVRLASWRSRVHPYPRIIIRRTDFTDIINRQFKQRQSAANQPHNLPWTSNTTRTCC